MTDATLVDLLRHGEVQGGAAFRGAQDDPLAPEGLRSMRAAVEGRGPWDAIVTSPLVRCRDFALGLAQHLELPCHSEARLREIHFGDWEGRSYAELMMRAPLALRRFYRDPARHPPPGGEPWADFQARIIEVLRELGSGAHGRRVLAVTHGGAIRAALGHVRGWPPSRLAEIDVPHASVHRLRCEAAGWREQ
jgi:broad specificity phosphatase PhoE